MDFIGLCKQWHGMGAHWGHAHACRSLHRMLSCALPQQNVKHYCFRLFWIHSLMLIRSSTAREKTTHLFPPKLWRKPQILCSPHERGAVSSWEVPKRTSCLYTTGNLVRYKCWHSSVLYPRCFRSWNRHLSAKYYTHFHRTNCSNTFKPQLIPSKWECNLFK